MSSQIYKHTHSTLHQPKRTSNATNAHGKHLILCRFISFCVFVFIEKGWSGMMSTGWTMESALISLKRYKHKHSPTLKHCIHSDVLDLSLCAHVFSLQKLGLLALVNEESHFPKGTDDTLLEKLHSQHSVRHTQISLFF